MGWHGACHGTRPHCTLKLTRAAHVSVTFAALAKLGSSSDPVPLGKPFAIGSSGWQLTVVSAIPDDTQALLTMTNGYGNINSPPPAGAQDFVASVTATYTGGGSGLLAGLLATVEAMGAHSYTYDTQSNSYGTLPPPVLDDPYGQSVFSGQSVTGNICWQVASNDAASLKLGVVPEPGAQGTWFALH